MLYWMYTSRKYMGLILYVGPFAFCVFCLERNQSNNNNNNRNIYIRVYIKSILLFKNININFYKHLITNINNKHRIRGDINVLLLGDPGMMMMMMMMMIFFFLFSHFISHCFRTNTYTHTYVHNTSITQERQNHKSSSTLRKQHHVLFTQREKVQVQ